MAKVILEAVSRTFPGGVAAVSNLNLQIHDREFFVLVGPSGCGKTTALRLIAGLEQATAGTIQIAGRVVNEVSPKDRNIAMVFQNYALYPHLNVFRNMAFGLELRNAASLLRRGYWSLFNRARLSQWRQETEAIRQRVRSAAGRLGIEGLLGRMPAELSGGERQRVALGRAIVRQPEVFLFDEPLSNLDASLRADMRRELKQLHRQLGATIVHVTHDQIEALTLGDRIAVMNRGTAQQVGTPLEVFDRPVNRFVAGFLGTPPMNLIEGRLVQDHEHHSTGNLQFHGGGWRLPVHAKHVPQLASMRDRKVVMGLRPDQIRTLTGNESEFETVVSAETELVEPTGDATIIHFAAAKTDGSVGAMHALPEKASTGNLLVSYSVGRHSIEPGDRIRIHLSMQNAHWFAAETGENLIFAGKSR